MTAVTTIPVAIFDVVVVVAVIITLELGASAFVYSLGAVTAVARTLKVAFEQVATNTVFTRPLRTGSSIAQVLLAFIFFFIDFTPAAVTVTTIAFFQTFAGERHFLNPVVTGLVIASRWALRLCDRLRGQLRSCLGLGRTAFL